MIQRPILIIAFLTLLLVSGAALIWLPQYQDFQELRLEVREKKVWLEQKETYFSNLENAARRLQEYSQEVTKIESVLPSTYLASDLLNFFTKISSESGLLLQSFDPGSISPLGQSSNIFKVPITISLSGSYPSFKNFLSALQASSRLFEVETISFGAPTTEAIFKFDLKIRTHSY